MFNGGKILGIITARGGSKRLPNKNILDLGGKPLIAWTIEEARKSKYIDKLIVSTDSEEIAEISKKNGADIPFMRPENLSSDTADSISVIKHAIDFFKGNYDYIILLQPTSPLKTTEDIDSAIEMLTNDTKAIISVCEVEHSPLWANTLPFDLNMKNFIKADLQKKRSQDLPRYYRLNGAIYISEIPYLYDYNGFIGDKTKAYIMPQDRSIDIDTELDFELCDFLINKGNWNKTKN